MFNNVFVKPRAEDKLAGTLLQATLPRRKNGGVYTRVWRFYVEGFKSMTVGKTLWIIIIAKVFILFAILKIFFFPDFLSFLPDEAAKSEYVAKELTTKIADE